MDKKRGGSPEPDEEAPFPKESGSATVKKGKNYILAIGIDQYAHHRALQNAVADAKGFADLMTNRYGFEHLNEPLYDNAATRRNIIKNLNKCKQLTEDDRLIVFYSGHGWYETAIKLGFLVPTDAEDDPHNDFVAVTTVVDILKTVKAHHILLVVDCCFGGSFSVERDVKVDTQPIKVVADLDKKKSRWVLSSGGIEPVSDGLVMDNNSPFTKPLIAILRENQEPSVVMLELFPLLRKNTNYNAHQMPEYNVLRGFGHAGGELALYCTDLETAEERAYRLAMETQSIPLLAPSLLKIF